MIAMIKTGKSFSRCIAYCLDDKRELSKEQKTKLMNVDGLQHQGRAEVLLYNQCFGNKNELPSQFRDVSKLSKRVEKPVLHIAVRLAPTETLSKQQWIEVAQKTAEALGVLNHQYLVIQHRDTKEEHIHIVANRVGFDGKAASTSNNFYKMDRLLRELEKQYNLQQVLSPKQFLAKEQRQVPRHDSRKEKMKADIKSCLIEAKNYNDFEQRMKNSGYQIIKGRGMSFIDDKKMKVKGSDLGFSLMTIEKLLQAKQVLAQQSLSEAAMQEPRDYAGSQKEHINQQTLFKAVEPFGNPILNELQRNAASLLNELLNPANNVEQMEAEAAQNRFKKKKKKRSIGI